MLVCILEHPRIRSENHFNDIANTPLWSCLMGGYATACFERAGHDVIFHDTTKTGWDFEKTQNEIQRLSPDLLCINAVYFWEHTYKLFEFLSALKSDGFTGHINLFGFFPTLAWEAILNNSDTVDSIAIGECEHTLTELADALDRKKVLDGIPGLAFLFSNSIMTSGFRPPIKDPDGFPFPKRNHSPDDTISILASRGCYNHCKFCPVPSFYNKGALWRGRSPENIYEEMAGLVDQGHSDFYFVDPNFIGPGKKGKERILRLMELIRPLKITFGMETRPNDLDPAILESLVSSGFNSLLLGIESGSPAVLGNLDKHASRNISEQAISLCRSFGIEPEIGFLMFVPDSTIDDLKHNFEFLMKNNLLDRLERTANLLSHYQIVLLGTSGYGMFEQQGRLKPSGIFGFEGEVDYHDKHVKWMSEIVIYACHSVLKEMERIESPVYWKNDGNSPVHKKLNDYLVSLFERLLVNAGRISLDQPGEMIPEIESDLQGILQLR